MPKYHAIRACTWRGKYWEKGQVYEGVDEPPHHFIAVDKPIPAEPLPRLGAKTAQTGQLFPSLKSPGKADFPPPEDGPLNAPPAGVQAAIDLLNENSGRRGKK